MSGSLTPTVAATPNAVQFASNLMALMAALTGQATDYNQGSEIRTFSEADGLVLEQQSIGNAALALQSLAYGAMSLFGIMPTQATFSTGVATFATVVPVSAAFNVPQPVTIPSGTLMQTAGGVQFATVAQTILASGTSSVSVGIVAVTPGALGNIGSGAITGTPLNGLGYPLYVTNGAPTAGGANAGSQSLALAQFAARAASLGLSSPVAIANAVIGVNASGTGESVAKSAVFEPWIAAGSGAGSGQAGFTLFVDNGTGTASNSLLTAVQNYITGSVASNQSGYRPAGVPFGVSAVTAVLANVAVTGVLLPGLLATGGIANTIGSGVVSYFNNLGISPNAAYQPQVAAVVADAGLNGFQSLIVNLYYNSAPSVPVPVVSGGVGTRAILNSLSINISVGT